MNIDIGKLYCMSIGYEIIPIAKKGNDMIFIRKSREQEFAEYILGRNAKLGAQGVSWDYGTYQAPTPEGLKYLVDKLMEE